MPILRSVNRSASRHITDYPYRNKILDRIGGTQFSISGYSGAWAVLPRWLTSESDGTTTVNDQRSGLGTDRPRQPGRALTFNGTQSGTFPAISVDGEFCLFGWLKTNNTSGFTQIFGNIAADSNLARLDTGKFKIGTGLKVSTNSADGVWHPFMLYRDASNDFYIYQDGLDITETVYNDASTYVFDQIGRTSNGVLDRYWIGQLFDLGILDRSPTADEIAAHAAGVTPDDNLLAQWHLDDNSTKVAFDSASGSHATLVNDPVTYEGADVPKSYQNDYGYSIGFATNDTLIESTKPVGLVDVEFDIITTQDDLAVITNSDLGAYLIFAEKDSTGTLTTSLAGSPTITIDGTVFTGNEGELQALISDGEVHSILLTDVDFSAAGWNSGIYAGGYRTPTRYGFTDTIIFNVKIGGVDYPGPDYIPLLATDKTKDIFGNTPTYIGEAPNTGQALAHNVLKLDGTQAVVFTPIELTGDFELEFYFVYGGGSNRTLFSHDTNTAVVLRIQDTTTLRFNNGGTFVDLTVPDMSVEIRKYKLTRSGSVASIYVNDVLQDTQTGASTGTYRLGILGARASAIPDAYSEYISGQVFGVKAIDGDGTKLLDIPCADGDPGSTVASVTERVSGTLLPIVNPADNWATSDFGPHVNLEQGFSKAENIFLYSNTFDNPEWVPTSNTTTTVDYADGPFAGTRATRVEMGAVSATALLQGFALGEAKGSTDYRMSAWIKATSADCSFDFFHNFGPSNVQFGEQTATSEWQLFVWEFTTGAFADPSSLFGLNNGSDTYALDVLIYNFQLEESPTGDAPTLYETTDTRFYPSTRIPAHLTDPTLDALNNSKTNPPVVGNNGSESTLIFTKEPDDPINYNKDIPGNGTLAAAAFDGDYGDVVVGVDLPKREGQFYLPKFDTLTWDYISQVKAAGGTIGSESYSNLYSKQKLNDFIVNLRDIGVWDATLEMYLFGGPVDFAGSLVKLKTYAALSNTLTNNGFVAGDLNQTGSLLGLKGDNSSYLSTGLLDTVIPVDSGFAACAVTEDSGTTFDTYAGVEVSGNSQCYKFGENTPAGRLHAGNSAAGGAAGGYVENFFSIYPEPQVIIFDMTDHSDIGIYVDGGENIATMSGLQSFRNPTGVYDLTLFGLNRTGAITDRTVARLPLIIIGKDTLTESQRTGLDSAMKTFLNAFGAGL
jgi:hypothetical protein